MVAVPDLIVIPARHGSRRLPGKPLLSLNGRSLLERVVANARVAATELGDCAIIVATDDRRIADHVTALGVDYVMTAPELDSGTLRTQAAVRRLDHPPSRIINLQGDAPFVPPHVIAKLMHMLRYDTIEVATPVFQLDWERLDRLREHKRTAPFSGTTCIKGPDNRALWFSKSIIPAIREEAMLRAAEAYSPVWQHLGLYGYSLAALDWFATASPSRYELLEGLEQLRFLEAGWPIGTIAVDVPDHLLSGIDTAQDLAKAEQAIARYGDPFPK